jgi:DHA1 family multidrug resistance protein-like MFS transporter
MIGMSACVPFLPIYVRQLGITNIHEAQFWSSIVFAGPYILSIITVPIWGSLGDKYGRKRMVVRAIIGLAIAMFLMGFARNVWDLFLLRVLQGAVSGFIAASLAFVSAETPHVRSGFAISMLQSAQSAGTIIGPFAGGIFSDLFGIRPVFYIVSALCFISGLLIIYYVHEQNFIPSGKMHSSVLHNLKYIFAEKELRILIILVMITQGGIHFTSPVFPFFVETLNTPKEYFSTITGFLIGTVGIFSILFAAKWGRRSDTKHYSKTLIVSSTIVGVFTILQLFITNWIMLFPIRMIIGIFVGAIVPTIYSALSKRSNPDNVGGVMGIASSGNLLGALISFLLCAVISSQFGYEWIFILSGLTLLSVIPILLRFKLNSIKNVP